MAALRKLNAPGNVSIVWANINVYNGAAPIGESDSIVVVIEYTFPISLGETTLAKIERLIGPATPFSNAITLAIFRLNDYLLFDGMKCDTFMKFCGRF